MNAAALPADLRDYQPPPVDLPALTAEEVLDQVADAIEERNQLVDQANRARRITAAGLWLPPLATEVDR